MSAWERESGELPAPNLPPFGRKAGRGLFVSWLSHCLQWICMEDGNFQELACVSHAVLGVSPNTLSLRPLERYIRATLIIVEIRQEEAAPEKKPATGTVAVPNHWGAVGRTTEVSGETVRWLKEAADHQCPEVSRARCSSKLFRRLVQLFQECLGIFEETVVVDELADGYPVPD